MNLCHPFLMESQEVRSCVAPAPVLRSSSATEGGKAGAQDTLIFLDSGLRGNDERRRFPTFCESMFLKRLETSLQDESQL